MWRPVVPRCKVVFSIYHMLFGLPVASKLIRLRFLNIREYPVLYAILVFRCRPSRVGPVACRRLDLTARRGLGSPVWEAWT
jgi:hypothetical protein